MDGKERIYVRPYLSDGVAVVETPVASHACLVKLDVMFFHTSRSVIVGVTPIANIMVAGMV